MRVITLGIALTFALGFSLALAYFLVGGSLAWRGTYVLGRAWPFIYTLVALLAAGTSALVAALVNRRLPMRHFTAALSLAWLGEYLVLASGVLDDDLTPANAFGFWLLATGGPLQPLAACSAATLVFRKGRDAGPAPA